MTGSHNVAGYVINTAGLEDIGCRWYFYKLLVSFKQKIYENSFESLRNKFQWEFFNGSDRLSSLVSVQQNQPSLTSLLYHLSIIARKFEDLTESKHFFAEVFQITSKFVLAQKKIGG